MCPLTLEMRQSVRSPGCTGRPLIRTTQPQSIGPNARVRFGWHPHAEEQIHGALYLQQPNRSRDLAVSQLVVQPQLERDRLRHTPAH